MTNSYDLSNLNPEAFENIVNFLALKTLGLGCTGFGPGPDGGRDGYFEGQAPYPSESEQWKGVWYIQSKFHKPHLTKNAQKWLVQKVKEEIDAFDKIESDRNWPDNWIIATNIDPSGKSESGSFDLIKKILQKSPKGKKTNVHVWGGRKILNLLNTHKEVADFYGHFLTPGHIISALYSELGETRASVQEVIRYFIVTQFTDNMFTKLDQAGSSSDIRPKVHDLFIDLPFNIESDHYNGEILAELCCSATQCHRYSLRNLFPESWNKWNRYSKRARVILIKGGPGQGKSTVSQYLCQIHRARLILLDDLKVHDTVKEAANAVCNVAQTHNFFPISPRIPIQIELKEFAHWYSQQPQEKPKNILTYLAEIVAKKIANKVLVNTLKNLISKRSWIIVFDGLDEVPNDFKDEVAKEVMIFLNDDLVDLDGDVLAICTSRPQGYSGQFAGIDGPVVELSLLDSITAMRCAEPVLKFGRSKEESEKSIETLQAAILSPNVKELMTTPLQSHIMAVVVRDGGRPPERRWKLFNDFYQVMKKRESLKDFKNPRIARLLREEEKLLKSVHMRLGFVLHARAERSFGAQTALSKIEFRSLVHDVVTELDDDNIELTVADVMEAITERLVLVSTPENGEQVRFDIRQLQEFFAAEFLYTGVESTELCERIETIGVDPHWREVVHFLMSALIENQRTTELTVAVGVLCQLNEGDALSNEKLYLRRMAKATSLAIRLLLEGVLEQDRGDRQKIKPLLDPIGGIFDLGVLRGLSRITPPKSKQWLIQVLLDKVETANPREYVGALFLLGLLLPDEHEKSAQISNSFISIPIEWQEHIYNLWTPEKPHLNNIRADKNLVSSWVIDMTFDILNSPNWTSYSIKLIRQLLLICENESERFITICKKKGIEANLYNALLQCIMFEKHSIPLKKGDNCVDYGLIIATPYSENWINRKIPRSLNNLSSEHFIKSVDGLFRLMLICVWFAENPSNLSLSELIRNVDITGQEKMEILPGQLLALIPMHGRFSSQPYNIDHLRSIKTTDPDWLTKLEATNTIIQHYDRLTIQNSSTSAQWSLLSSHLPKIALDLAINADELNINKQVKFVPELISLFSDMPNEISRYILKWGCLEKSQPSLFKLIKANTSYQLQKKTILEIILETK